MRIAQLYLNAIIYMQLDDSNIYSYFINLNFGNVTVIIMSFNYKIVLLI